MGSAKAAFMNLGPQLATRFGQAERIRHFHVRVGAVMLLLAIAGFSTVAKNSQYYSNSNSAHFIGVSGKMMLSPLPVAVDQTPLRPVARLLPPQPEMRITQDAGKEVRALPSIGVTVSLQHRSPPLFLS